MQSHLSIEYVSPEAANEWLQYARDQRPLRTYHADYLAQEMLYGRFQETAEVHLFDVDKERYLINGQHTCAAIARYGRPVRVTVRRSAGTDVERALVYSVGHDKGISRTFTDSVRVYHLVDKMAIKKVYIDKIASAIRYARRSFGAVSVGGERRGVRVSDIELMGIVPQWELEAQLLNEAITPCTREMRQLGLRSDVLCVALLTMHYQPDRATEFWAGVTKGENLGENDSRLRLHNYLMTARYNAQRRLSEPPVVVTRNVIYSWNYFFDGNKPQVRKLRRDSINFDEPVRILGTHYTGKQPLDMWPNKVAYSKAA